MTGVLISAADTDLLAARASAAGWRLANPARLEAADVPALLDRASFVVVRLLGGRRSWPDGLDAVLGSGVPVVVLGGEATPEADLMALSTVPGGVAAETLAYLREGGPANLAQLANFLSDTVLLTGLGFDPPVALPAYGVFSARPVKPERPTVGIVFYRAHAVSGNTAFIEVLADAVESTGANVRPVYCTSLRAVDSAVYELLDGVDALIVTVLAAGGAAATDAVAGGDEDAWDVDALAALDVPVIQALCLTSSRAVWEASSGALTPMDAAMQVAIPEFDGRIISVPFSFKETGPDQVPVYVADAERAERVAGIAVRQARLRSVPAAEKRVAIVLSSYPSKHARVGNAVGLDTPASAVLLLRALRAAGYDIGSAPVDEPDLVTAGDGLIHQLIAAGGHDLEWLTEDQLAQATMRVPLVDYQQWFNSLPEELTTSMVDAWGEPPGALYVHDGDIVLAGLRFGNVVLMIQPPRGFGDNPIAIYHDPALAPSHHYLAAYRWLDETFGADAVVHLGKHGTLEWLPGKGLGLSSACAPDAVLGDLPLIYPFIVNDPGEGTQAKRRGHAVVIDHLVPPMARADSYGELAKLEQLLDEYATVAALDPAKVPAVRAQIWSIVETAQLHHDLHVSAQPDDAEFDDFVLHIDGYLCEIKDVQIRDGLHVLGRPPVDEPLVDLVLSVLRAAQMWGGRRHLRGLRAALADWVGLDEAKLLAEPGASVDLPATLTDLVDGPARSAADAIDLIEILARRLVSALAARGWADAHAVTADLLGATPTDVAAVLAFAATEVAPRLAATTDELTNTLRALDGRYIAAGPSGSPTRGLVNVLPTGRNFYSVDPKAIPSRNAWDVGVALAESLIARHRDDTGEYPQSVGLTVWGTSAMRTQGDDIAEVLALIGARPVWDDASRRVTGFEIVPIELLGRPRIDVTVRISGFFRDAFPHVITLLDDAISAVATLDEPDEVNYVRAHVQADLALHGDARRSTTRIFGSKPGAYGAGLLPLIDARNWRTDADLAEVYAVWGGYAYGRELDGREARGDMETAFRRIAVAAKNQDNREHDIVDSDDYFQYHGGMVAMVRHLTGTAPAAYVGDSAVPDQVRTRTLAEETKRVFRARVVNPKWITAMQRHGYKGAFEMSATVDYLFGYDATAGVVDDWMYEQLAASYVFDQSVRDFMTKSNPWALRGIAERLLEAADRGLWAEPESETLDGLRSVYLELEGDLEGGT
jgi:cobaltochelatase CobN